MVVREIPVKTIWQGKVGVPDFFVEDCINRGEVLKIVSEHGFMTLKSWEIKNAIVARSEQRFTDKYKKHPPYYLVYFLWKPQEKALKLF